MNATKKTNAVVQYLIQNFALVALADTQMEPMIRKICQAHKLTLMKELSKEELQPILVMSNTIQSLAVHLAKCQVVAQIEAVQQLVEELIAGKVYIVPDEAAHLLDSSAKEYEDGQGQ